MAKRIEICVGPGVKNRHTGWGVLEENFNPVEVIRRVQQNVGVCPGFAIGDPSSTFDYAIDFVDDDDVATRIVEGLNGIGGYVAKALDHSR